MTNEKTEIKLSSAEKKVVDAITKLTVVEASNVAKYFEQEFGISASPVAAMAAAPAATGGDGGGDTEAAKTEFDVVLKDCGVQKIAVIKLVREFTGLGLGEAKDLAEKGGKIKEAAKKEEAEEMKKKFEEAGAKAELE